MDPSNPTLTLGIMDLKRVMQPCLLSTYYVSGTVGGSLYIWFLILLSWEGCLLSPFYRWETWNTETCSGLSLTTQAIYGWVRSQQGIFEHLL